MPATALLEPLKIGNHLLKNRITMSAMPTGFGHVDGNISMTMLNYYARRARGQASLIVVEGAAVDESGRTSTSQIMADRDSTVSGLNRLARTIKENGATAALQLQHGGRLSLTLTREPKAPSTGTFECPVMKKKFTAGAMNTEEIESATTAFVKAAERAKDAGFDMVELGGGYGYLLSQFISPRTNTRQDKYGAGAEGRALFAIEIIEKIKTSLGADYPIGYQMMAEESVPGGLSIDDAKAFAKTLAEKGIAYLTITSGTPESFTLDDGLFAMRSPEGSVIPLAASIKQELNAAGGSTCPVFVSGKITDPKLCEQAVSSGQADGVALDRAIFCDPDLPSKIKADRNDEIIECVSCANCTDRVLKGLSADCTVNPTVGKEATGERSHTACTKKKILVGGSGPAGIFAALTAERRGHEVTMVEKGPKPGGHLKAAPKATGKSSWSRFLNHLQQRVERSSINLRLECELSEDVVKDVSPDVVIVATGVKLKKLTVPVNEEREVLGPGPILFGKKEGGKHNVIIGAGLVGSEIAEFLAEKGKPVDIVERLSSPAGEMDAINRTILLQKLDKYGVKIHLNANVKEITATKVIITDSDGKEAELEADTVVNATGFDPNNDPFFKLKDFFQGDIHIIGDARVPSNIHDAVHEGYQLGMNL